MGSPLATRVVFMLGPVPVTEPVVVTWGLIGLLTFAGLLARSRLSLVPSRGQAALELVVTAMQNLIRDTMRVSPEPYLPLLGTLFAFILLANWSSVVPGIEPPTAHIETDAALAAIVFVAVVYFGIRPRRLGLPLNRLRVGQELLRFLLPPGDDRRHRTEEETAENPDQDEDVDGL